MTIQTTISDGWNINTKIYRKVYKGKNLAQYREGFMAQQEHSEYGVMVQLKGKERIVLARFGKE